MNWIFLALASFTSGLLGSLGLGGGAVLLLYLTLFAKIDQLTAQGINLIFFIPVAITALILHWKNHLVQWKPALIAILIGLFGVWFGVMLAHNIGSELLSKLFGGMLLVIGIKELCYRPPKGQKNTTQK